MANDLDTGLPAPQGDVGYITSPTLDPMAANPLSPNLNDFDRMIIGSESNWQNIPNYRYDPTHTAGGYGQITDSTWRQYAPLAGVDLERYPIAMKAPFEDQLRVMHAIQSERGVAPWANYNPQLANQLTKMNYGSGLWKEPIGSGTDKPFDLSSMSKPVPGSEAPATNIYNFGAGAGTADAQRMNPVMLLSLLKTMMAGTHSFTPINYDPFKIQQLGKTTSQQSKQPSMEEDF